MDHFLVNIIDKVSDYKLNSYSWLLQLISLLVSGSFLASSALQMLVCMAKKIDSSHIVSFPLNHKTSWTIKDVKSPDIRVCYQCSFISRLLFTCKYRILAIKPYFKWYGNAEIKVTQRSFFILDSYSRLLSNWQDTLIWIKMV
jgi:hypothetical protein